jgi:Ni,Fe-hydrogenase I small subunit
MDFCEALSEVLRHNIVWIEAQSCSGESIMILKSGCLGLQDLFFHSSPIKLISIYTAENSGDELLKEILGMKDFLLVVEGALPLEEDLCKIGNFTCSQLIKNLARNSLAVVAVGSCAVNGGILKEGGVNSIGVRDLIKDKKVYEVLGCPASDKMIVATLYYILKGEKSERDRDKSSK